MVIDNITAGPIRWRARREPAALTPNPVNSLSNMATTDPTLHLGADGDEPQFLVAALVHFKANDRESWEALTALAGSHLHSGMRPLLAAGKLHEEELLTRYSIEMPEMRLCKSQDKRNELVYVPYKKAGEAVRKCIKEFLPAMPTFDGRGTAVGFAKECKSIVKQVLDARREYVRPFLSKYHLYYLKNQISAKTRTVFKDQKHTAQLCSASRSETNVEAVPHPTVHVVAPSTTRGNDAGCVPSSTVQASHEPSRTLPVLPLSCSAIQGPSMRPISISMNEPKTNIPATQNPIGSTSPQSVPLALDPEMTEHDSLLTSGFEFVQENCGDDFRWLKQKTAGGSNMSPLKNAIRAYRFGVKQGRDCIQHRRLVEQLHRWVLEAMKSAPNREYNMTEIEFEAVIYEELTTEEREKLAIEAIVSKTVDVKMAGVLKRKNVLLSWMSSADLHALNHKIEVQREHLSATELESARSIYCHGLHERIRQLQSKIQQNSTLEDGCSTSSQEIEAILSRMQSESS